MSVSSLPDAEPDPVHGWMYLSAGYLMSDPGYDDRVTVPVLWDTETDRIVSNESSEILEMLNSEWDAWAEHPLFKTLDRLEGRLATQRYLLGDAPTLADWRLFTTLVRFDAVYYGHFKCTIRRIVDYPDRSAYLRDLYATPGVAETVDFDHIKRHYYVTHTSINPTQIVPVGPALDLTARHGRAALAPVT